MSKHCTKMIVISPSSPYETDWKEYGLTET